MVPLAANALPTGISGYSGKGGGSVCSSCHTPGAVAPTVAITGPATLTVGMTGSYTLTVTGGPAKSAGMNAALSGVNSANAILTAGTGNRLSNGELVHSAAAQLVGNVATFAFSIKAPLTAGLFSICAAGLSSNADGTSSSDGTGKTAFDVNVADPAGGVPAPVIPSADAGAPAEAPLIPTSTGGSTAPLSAGVVEGEGCSSAGGLPLLGLIALVALSRARRLAGRKIAVGQACGTVVG